MILCISGTPGTGKTAASEALAGKLGWKLVHLHDLAREKGCISGFDRKRKCDIVDTKKLSKAVSKLRGNFILESHYSHEVPCDRLVILRTDPGILRARLRKKGWPEKKVEENALAEIMEVCCEEARELGKDFREVDTTGKGPEKVAGEILKVLGIK